MTLEISEIVYNISMILLVLTASFIITRSAGRFIRGRDDDGDDPGESSS